MHFDRNNIFDRLMIVCLIAIIDLLLLSIIIFVIELNKYGYIWTPKLLIYIFLGKKIKTKLRFY